MSNSGRMDRILRLMAERRASDVFLSANMAVLIKIDGQMMQLSEQVLTPQQPRQLLAEVLSPRQLEELDDVGEMNVGIAVERVGSFRLSAFKQRGSVAGVVRHIPHVVPSLDELKLPPLLGQLVLEKRGLVLVVGATGSGKSTTMAALIEARNRTVAGHILTIEDPIEFLFQNKKCLVNQREVGRDTESFHVALKNALRQSPDCIMIGEIRDRETMGQALSYALSGHLVIASMHANNAHHALGRILSFYPPEVRPVLLLDLAAGLKSIVSQRLLRTPDGKRVPAVEVLLNNNLVAELIEKGDLVGIREAMARSTAEGSRTFEEDIARLIADGTIEREEGLIHADSPTNLTWRMQNQPDATTAAAAAAAVLAAGGGGDDGAIYTDFVVDVPPIAPPPAATTAASAPLARTR